MKRDPQASEALRQTMSHASASALSAMASMLGGGSPWRQGITEHVPLERLKAVALGDMSALGACLTLHMGGSVGGLFAMLLDTASAKALCTTLLGSAAPNASDELSDSALTEVCNIVGCAFGIAVQGLTKGAIKPSVPELVYGELSSSIMRACSVRHGVDALTVQFLSQGGDIMGRLVWTLTPQEQQSLAQQLLVKQGVRS